MIRQVADALVAAATTATTSHGLQTDDSGIWSREGELGIRSLAVGPPEQQDATTVVHLPSAVQDTAEKTSGCQMLFFFFFFAVQDWKNSHHEKRHLCGNNRGVLCF